MCGICGSIDYADAPLLQRTTLEAMNAQLQHRGPDGDGFYRDASAGVQVSLAMRRLSIIDVAGSDQPLFNEDRSVVTVFNGEIFNFAELRDQLYSDGHQFRTGGDGETIVHLYEMLGDETPRRLRGQFAFALWDATERRLLLARDRMGQKPLYYYHDEQHFVFASEIKALLMHPAVPRRARFGQTHHLATWLGYGATPEPDTAFEGIHALPPGHTLVWQDGAITCAPYWTMIPVSTAAQSVQSETHLLAQLREHLQEAVRLRMIADVPLGAFLSGGLDSSLIVALMQQMSSQPVRTFSIGFSDSQQYDETAFAQQVADHLHTEHTAFTLTPAALDHIESLVWHHDQPFADTSALPTWWVSRMTRQHVTVALSGDGSDELFAGYDRFRAFELLQRFGAVPDALWRAGHSMLGALPQSRAYSSPLRRAQRFVQGAMQPPELAYFDWVRVFDAGRTCQVMQHATATDEAGRHFAALVASLQADAPLSLTHILQANLHSYLPDVLLVKADRCSMQASLELRAPFLDHHLVDFVNSLPLSMKLRGGTSKYLLRQLAADLLPHSIVHRPKHGFGLPIGSWLQGRIGQVRQVLLDPQAQRRGLFDAVAVEQLISQHAAGERDHGRMLWSLLTLEHWYRLFIDPVQSVAPQPPDASPADAAAVAAAMVHGQRAG